MMMKTLKQRAEYTHKYNLNEGRHGWLRLTPAYSVKIVNEILLTVEDDLKVLDPFSGTATTALCASCLGLEAATVELNPFLVWFGKTKTARYSENVLSKVKDTALQLFDAIEKRNGKPLNPPPLHNIERWWSHPALSFLCKLKEAIDNTLPKHGPTRSLLYVAFCRTMIKTSNAAFNHQSMSFKEPLQDDLFGNDDEHFKDIFMNDIEHIISTASLNPSAKAEILNGDSRDLEAALKEKYDLLITSPPYPNRMSYIRELRPYMYWLGYLETARQAGEIDWQAIGGTWGVATSRLQEWMPDNGAFCPSYLPKILDDVSHEDNKNGRLLSNYIYKYFVDMWLHFKSLPKVLNKNARVHYIIGNSTFYGVLVPAEKIYADMLSELGFKNVDVKPIRKRNSKKELFEFDVSATW